MTAEFDTMPEMSQINRTSILNDQLIEEIWRDLSGKVTRDQVREVALATMTEFQDATVTAFIPILLRRRTFERLSGLINQ
jgi:hypothetical protein